MAIWRYDEDTLWDLAWLLFGGPVMVTGFFAGARHDDLGLMIGTLLIILLIFYCTRGTLAPLLRKDRSMFGLLKKNKSTTTTLLSVVDHDNRTRLGVLEVVRGNFHRNDRLHIFALYSLLGREGEGMKVFVVNEKGRETGAGTLVVRNGNFHENQRLRVESIDVM